MRRVMSFNISGRAMGVIQGSSLYESPDSTDPDAVEASRILQRAEWHKRGKGESYLVTTDSEGAASVIQDYCAKTGKLFLGESDQETKRDGDALLVVADRIEWKLKELQ